MSEDVTPVTRIDPLAGPSTTPNPPLSHPAAGAVIPPGVAPYASVAVVVAGALLAVFPPGGIPFVICSVVVAVGSALGIMSPGYRRPQ